MCLAVLIHGGGWTVHPVHPLSHSTLLLMSRHLVTTLPSVAVCVCGRPVIVGLSEGLRAATDPVLLGVPAQVVAARAGIWVYWLRPTGLHLRETVPDIHPWHVLVPEHRCGIRWRSDDTAQAPVRGLRDRGCPY